MRNKTHTMSAISEFIKKTAQEIVDNVAENKDWREAARQTGGVPILMNMGGIITITSDGKAMNYDPDTKKVELITDEIWKTVASVAAGRVYPQLRDLAPERPAEAIDCSTCSGTGGAMEDGLCDDCLGKGWRLP